MQFVLNINVDNAAFGETTEEETRRGMVGYDCKMETARILREIAGRVESGDIETYMRTIYDANGNDVGRAAFKVAHELAH